MHDDIDWQRLGKYIAGECSPRERREVDAWIEGDPSRKKFLEHLRRIWEAAERPPADGPDFPLDMEAEWKDMQEKMRASEQVSPSPGDRSPAEPSRSSRGRPTRSNAPRSGNGMHQKYALLLVLLVGGLFLAQQFWGTPGTGDASSDRIVVTERGERSRLQLPDGSKVMLNVDSELRFARVFGRNERVVHLDGEAFFDVASDSTRPFVVQTNKGKVGVHGTAFNVRSYSDEDVQVAVKEGRVSLEPRQATSGGAGVELEPGELGQVTDEDAIVTQRQVRMDSYFGWTEGRLVFRDTALPDVATRLDRWFGLEFRIQDARLDSLRLTANLKSQSVRDVLDVISRSLGIQYRIDNNAVLLAPKEEGR